MRSWAGRDSEARGRLSTYEAVALLVHDLRSPLGAIQNALQVLRLVGGADRNVERAVALMERQAGHMGQLIGDLLDLARVTTGPFTPTAPPASGRNPTEAEEWPGRLPSREA